MLSGPPVQLAPVTDAQGEPLAEYLFYPESGLLYVRWHGHLTGAEVIRGVAHTEQWRGQFTYALILNDKSDTGGDWSEAIPWLQYEWLPAALAEGVKAIAYVFSPDRENRIASQEFIEAVRPHLTIEMFEDLALALAWLLEQKQGSAATAPTA